MSWFESNNEAIIVFATIVMALSTIGLVVITFWYAKITNKILRIANTPEMAIFLYPNEKHITHIYLCIQNVGTGVAIDIQFEGDLSFSPPMDPPRPPISEGPILKNGIDCLPPGKNFEIFMFATASVSYISEQSLDITVKYKDFADTEYERNFVLEYSKWEGFGSRFVERGPINEIADTLKNLEQELRRYLPTLKKHTIKREIRMNSGIITLPRDNQPYLKFKGIYEGGAGDEFNGWYYRIYKTDDSVKSCDYVLYIDRSQTEVIVAMRYEAHTFDSIDTIKSYIEGNVRGMASIELLEILGIDNSEHLV